MARCHHPGDLPARRGQPLIICHHVRTGHADEHRAQSMRKSVVAVRPLAFSQGRHSATPGALSASRHGVGARQNQGRGTLDRWSQTRLTLITRTVSPTY